MDPPCMSVGHGAMKDFFILLKTWRSIIFFFLSNAAPGERRMGTCTRSKEHAAAVYGAAGDGAERGGGRQRRRGSIAKLYMTFLCA